VNAADARWERVNALFHAALARAPATRDAFLSAECRDDAGLRREVQSLLDAHDDSQTSDSSATVGVGFRIGDYQITGFIAKGGMGEVYRARDRKLGREVALKILPAAFVADPDRRARFEREARVLASLNHPHIATIYGFEEEAGVHALALEFVDGETLDERIAHGKVPLDDTLQIARQVAEALAAAHEQGIIHRDLKPGNIKVTPDGTVKVLDFGLAKLAEPAGSGPPAASSEPLSMSPTITSPVMMTGVGVLLGTAAYMSPEQAKGKPADKRSDVWSFGCVLYEMLTGERPFDGEDVTDVMVAVLSKEPDWSALPTSVPGSIRALIRRCLEKDRRRRVADIAAALFVLDEHASLGGSTTVLRHRPLWRSLTLPVGGALLASAAVGAVVWSITRPVDPEPPRVSRLALATSGTAALTINAQDRDLAITPDGSRVVYVGNNGTQLFVRALDALEPVALFTGTPRGPFVSPDGQWIGFVENSSALKKIALTGGPAVTLATLDGNAPRGAAWGPDDAIIFATTNAATGLQRVGATGGPTTVLTRPDAAHGEADHYWPELLPGGRAVLFTIRALTGGLDAAQVAVLDLQTGTRTILVRGGSHAHYVPSRLGLTKGAERDGGHLVYATAGTLRAVPFDLATLKTRDTPVPVIPAVVTKPFGAVDAVVAGDGTLAYVSGGDAESFSGKRTLVWVDRKGQETPIPAPVRAYNFPRLSPDGTRIAVFAQDEELDLWLWDLPRTKLTRLTLDPRALEQTPVWTPDGLRLVFSSDRAGVPNLYAQAADGTGSATRLTDSANPQVPTGITADGTRVIFYELTPSRQRDLRLLTLTPTPRVAPLLETPSEERGGIVSPDGRWLAYESNSAGRFEIYVRPFPNVGDGQWQVTNAGGVQPLWARSGRELFYLAPDGALLTLPVDPGGTTWSAGAPTKLVAGRYFAGAGNNVARQYDVSPDGQRFLMLKEVGGTDQAAATTSLIVVQHWNEELKRLVPVK
jgi:serine/threonine-protein kinase